MLLLVSAVPKSSDVYDQTSNLVRATSYFHKPRLLTFVANGAVADGSILQSRVLMSNEHIEPRANLDLQLLAVRYAAW